MGGVCETLLPLYHGPGVMTCGESLLVTMTDCIESNRARLPREGAVLRVAAALTFIFVVITHRLEVGCDPGRIDLYQTLAISGAYFRPGDSISKRIAPPSMVVYRESRVKGGGIAFRSNSDYSVESSADA
jgi:hypothetical protein